MINPTLDITCHEALDKDCKEVFSQDRFYSPPANELRQAWKQALATPERAALAGYRRAQKFHRFVRQQAAPLNALTKTRQQNPLTYGHTRKYAACMTNR
jgi:hypothetical protein